LNFKKHLKLKYQGQVKSECRNNGCNFKKASKIRPKISPKGYKNNGENYIKNVKNMGGRKKQLY
jgi:hypothetical protein